MATNYTTVTPTLNINSDTPVGNVPLTVNVQLAPAEAKTLRQLRDGFVHANQQPSSTDVGRTIRMLLQQIATAL